MIKEKILLAYEEMAEKYNELIDHKPHNAYYDRPNTLKLIEEPKDKFILDAACGPGKYAEILTAKGAKVTGCDISPKMITLAKARNPDSGEFFVQDLELQIDSIENAEFDIVLCALALHYIQDWTLTIQEFYRILKPRGELIISIEHPFFEYNYFQSEKYFEIEHVKCTWNGFGKPIEVNSFRRPLSECISPLTNNGFYIDKLIEPLPVKEFEAMDPKHFEELNFFPAFMCIKAIKKD